MQSALTQENIGALVNWCHSHQYRPDIAEDEMFVLPGAVLPETLAWEGEADIRARDICSFHQKAPQECGVAAGK